MYTLEIGNVKYNVPDESLGMLAYSKGFSGNIFDNEAAKEYLESLGCKITEEK